MATGVRAALTSLRNPLALLTGDPGRHGCACRCKRPLAKLRAACYSGRNE